MSRLIRPHTTGGGVIALVIGMAFGAVFLAAGLWVRSTTQPLDDGVEVVAEVVDVAQSTDSDGDRMYSPIVEYYDPETGQTHRVQGSVASSSRPAIGSTEHVSFRPGDPSSARVVGPVWFPWIFIGVGGGIILISLLSIGKARARSSATNNQDDAAVPNRPVSLGGPIGRSEGSHGWTMADEPAAAAPSAQPGFHPDPDDDGRLRYWDGQRWTDNYAPVVFED